MDMGINDNKKEKEQNEIYQTLNMLFNGIHGKLYDLIKPRQQKICNSSCNWFRY